MPKKALEVMVSEALLKEIEELKSVIQSLIPLSVTEGLCYQCGGKNGHQDWCLVGKAEEVVK